jgi:hypothetical protein
MSNTNVINTDTNISNNFPGILFSSANVDGWAASDQQINVGFSSHLPHLSYGVWSNATPLYSNGDAYMDQFLGNISQVIDLLSSGFQYAFATGAWTSNASTYKIEATILGADKVRPYECIKFDNTVPIRYQGKHFRPTSLSYDLKADKVKVTAYQIDSFPIPTANINNNVGDCESGDMVSLFTYNTFTNVFADETGENTSNEFAFNAFTNVFADETGENTTTLDAFNSAVDAYSNTDGDLSNVTQINL